MVESTGATSGSEGGLAEVYAGSNVSDNFTISDAKALIKPTDKLLCTLSDNTFIRFGEYKVCDYDTRHVLLHVSAEVNSMNDFYARQMEEDGSLTVDMRTLKHDFPKAFFMLRNLELNLEFTNVNGD